MAAIRVLFVGACNADFVWVGPRLPRPGETVGDGRFSRSWGGKGANQAAAAARLGAHVSLLAAVGDDDLGRAALAALDRVGVDTAPVRIRSDEATGTALITVDGAGENTILVAPGANGTLTATEISDAVTVTDAEVVVTGYEIGSERARDALAAARARGLRTVCNPSPVDPSVASFADCSVVVVNEHEAEAYGGAEAILTAGAGQVVVTRGGRGALRRDPTGSEMVEGFAVRVVDTTGAGDTFLAALAVTDDLRMAAAAGALACRAVGARAGHPSASEIGALLSAAP